jgi:hypothetical protein
VRIRGIQRDLVVNRIFFTCDWLKLYKCKISLELENSKEKHRKTLEIGGVPGWILLCWNVGMAERKFWIPRGFLYWWKKLKLDKQV